MDLAVRKMTLESFGVENLGAVHENLPPARLVEASVRRREGMISEPSGALVVRTGKRTGRSPKDRFIVENDVTRDAVNWGSINKPFSSEAFGSLLEKAASYVENLEEVYVVDAYAGADPRYRLNAQVVTEHAWQALFARQLFRRPSRAELDSFEPDWTVLSVPGLLTDPGFRAGVEALGRSGLSFDAWLYSPQLGELVDLARRCPDVTIVVDHLGGPPAIGPYAARRPEVLAGWRIGMASVAACPNVCLKLGGFGMPIMGPDWHERPAPPSSEDVASEWGPTVRWAVEAFGADRCMFESNFPVDGWTIGYAVLWNACKRMVSDASPAERDALFRGTATRVYRLGG